MQENKIYKESKLDNYEEKRKKVSFFHLTSDIFFSKVMEDLQACQEVIQILTEQKLKPNIPYETWRIVLSSLMCWQKMSPGELSILKCTLRKMKITSAVSVII